MQVRERLSIDHFQVMKSIDSTDRARNVEDILLQEID